MATPLRVDRQEGDVNRTALGWIVGFVGAGLGAWWWRQTMMSGQTEPAAGAFKDRGTVIFDNTPRPSGADLTL
jgi:hypothetical protein